MPEEHAALWRNWAEESSIPLRRSNAAKLQCDFCCMTGSLWDLAGKLLGYHLMDSLQNKTYNVIYQTASTSGFWSS